MRYKIVDEDSGKLFEAWMMGDGNRWRARRKIKAMVKYCIENGGCYYWTIGTAYPKGSIEEYNKKMDALTRRLPGNWLYVIECGTKASRLHCHLLTNEYHDWHKMKGIWAAILDNQENPHIYVKRLMGDEDKIAFYLSKYCSKQQTLTGVRTLRSSKNLTRLIENYFEQKKEIAVFAVKGFYHAEKIEWNFEGNDKSNVCANTGKG